MSKSLDSQIPPDVPVRDGRGRVYCNRKCAASAGVLIRDLAIITYAQRHEKLPGGERSPVAKYIGYCAWCDTII